MNTRSAKAKGRRFEKWLVSFFQSIDPYAHRIVGSGSGEERADVNLPSLFLRVEAKNHKRYALADWMQQFHNERKEFPNTVLAFKTPESSESAPDVFIIVHADDYLRLLSGGFPHTDESTLTVRDRLMRIVNSIS